MYIWHQFFVMQVDFVSWEQWYKPKYIVKPYSAFCSTEMKDRSPLLKPMKELGHWEKNAWLESSEHHNSKSHVTILLLILTPCWNTDKIPVMVVQSSQSYGSEIWFTGTMYDIFTLSTLHIPGLFWVTVYVHLFSFSVGLLNQNNTSGFRRANQHHFCSSIIMSQLGDVSSPHPHTALFKVGQYSS